MYTLNCKGRLLTFHQPLIMGILNTTPDPFYPGSRTGHKDELLQRAEKMIRDGAAILDVGGQSTRPGSVRVGAEEEAERVVGAIGLLHRYFPEVVLSVDTFYSTVARAAVEAGASLINDVSAGSLDPQLLPTVAELGVPYVLMHMQGDPQTMQQNPAYDDVVLHVFDFFSFRLRQLEESGIKDIIIDPGFGFGKTIAHNFELLRRLSLFQQLQKTLLVGISRKGTIYKTLDITADEALNGTTVLHTLALLNGAQLLRVHDVREAAEAVKLVERYRKQ